MRIAGVDERIERTPQEEAAFGAKVKDARMRQSIPLLRTVAQAGEDGLAVWGDTGRTLTHLAGLGLTTNEVVQNPSPHGPNGVLWRLTEKGRDLLAMEAEA